MFHKKSFITTWSECVKTMMYYATNAYDCTNECEEMYMKLQGKVTTSKAQPSRGKGRRNVERSITKSIGSAVLTDIHIRNATDKSP